jgi:phospholipid-translocating ATPase
MGREALDDITRRRRDAEANSEYYQLLGSIQPVKSRDIKVGDVIKVEKDQRIPVDLMLLRTGDGTGEAFIKTDQLDGETDWKLRTALGVTQDANSDDALLTQDFCLTAGPPEQDIHKFAGKLALLSTDPPQEVGVSIDNMMWANTVLASGPHVTGLVVYTGTQTRQAQNTSKARVKFGLLEHEINNLSKILCAITLGLSILLVALHTPEFTWYISILRFLILFSTIIPVRYSPSLEREIDWSLRVNLDLGKLVYAYQIEHDKDVAGTVVRTSTIPEELGRIEYLFTDKMGTITKNGSPSFNGWFSF